jgi:hypothetical protein
MLRFRESRSEVRSVKRTLVAVLCSLLVSISALAAESPAAKTSAGPAAAARAPAVTGDATATTTPARTDRAAFRKSRRAPADDAANKSEVKQLQLKAPNDGTVCRTESPTGSRIGVKRCYSTTETDSSKVQNEIVRREFEEMRDRQIYEQLQRASVGMTPTVPRSPSR